MNGVDNRTVIQSTYVWLPQTLTWLYNQVNNLQGWNSVVMCNETTNLDQFPWPDVRALRDHGFIPYYTYKAHRMLGTRRHPPFFEKILARVKPGLMHSHFGPKAWKDLLLAEKFEIPQIVTFYGFDVNKLVQQEPVWRTRYEELFGRVRAVLCEGPHMAECIVNLGCPAEKVRVHHLGVDLGLLPFKPREWKPGEPLKILCAASFVEKKGMPYAVEGVGMFCREHPDMDVQLSIVGDATQARTSVELKQTILELFSKWGLADRTELLGFMPYRKMIELAYDHHLFLSPSVTSEDGDTEGGAPVSIIELAASGMPVVSTTHCDIPNVLGEVNRGYLVDERDSPALARTLSSLASVPEQWQAIASDNRKRIEQEFSAAEQGVKLGRVYDEVSRL
jgi:colanic acid/amylovoran biosynthesis glycosyltransferase